MPSILMVQKTPTGQFDWYIEDGADPELIIKQELAFDEANLSSSQPISKTGTIDVVVGSDGLDGLSLSARCILIRHSYHQD